MAANINTELNLNPLVERLLDNPYGLAVFIAVTALSFVIILFFSISKSGILTSIREHQEYKSRKTKEEIKDTEELLDDESYKKHRNKIKYHLDVLKLNKLLKYSHHDKELLEYILSCKDKNSAISYFESSKQFLEKDNSKLRFKLKSCFSVKYLDALNIIGTIFYFGISLGSLYPTAFAFYMAITTDASLKNIPFSFITSQFLLFILSIFLGLMILTPMIRPWKAKQFLELEKIENDQANVDSEDSQKAA